MFRRIKDMLKRDSLQAKAHSTIEQLLSNAGLASTPNGNIEDELIAIKLLLIKQGETLDTIVKVLNEQRTVIVNQVSDPVDEVDSDIEAKNKSKRGRPRKEQSVFIPSVDTSGMTMVSESIKSESSPVMFDANPLFKTSNEGK